jgi:hypothetical protein
MMASWDRRRLLGRAAGLVATPVALAIQSAAAGRGWCRSDPVLLIDGVPADLFCTAPLTAPLDVTGPTQIVVTQPPDVAADVLVPDLIGFGRGVQLSFAHAPRLQRTPTGVEVEIAVLAPARTDFALSVAFAPRLIGLLAPMRAEGHANAWLTLAAGQPPLLPLAHGSPHRHRRIARHDDRR